MKALKIIDSLIQMGFIITILLMLKSETLTSTLLITYLYLGPYQVLSQFLHYLFYKRTKLRKIYAVGVLVFFLGVFLFSALSKFTELDADIQESLGTVSFFLSTTLLAMFYMYISFSETYKEIRK